MPKLADTSLSAHCGSRAALGITFLRILSVGGLGLTRRSFDDTRIALFPTPAVVVTATNNAGQVGAATIGWNGILSSRPPVISVSFLPDSFTRSCMIESREFVVNVPDGSYWREMNHLGACSGEFTSKMASRPAEVRLLNLEPSAMVRAPRIAEFYLTFECRVLNVIQIGLYDCFLGEVLAMNCDDAFYLDTHRKGMIDHQRVKPVICLADEYWSGSTKLGVSTENKNHPHGSEH